MKWNSNLNTKNISFYKVEHYCLPTFFKPLQEKEWSPYSIATLFFLHPFRFFLLESSHSVFHLYSRRVQTSSLFSLKSDSFRVFDSGTVTSVFFFAGSFSTATPTPIKETIVRFVWAGKHNSRLI